MRNYRVLRPAPKPQLPVAALQLSEDTERLRMALALLKKVDCESIGTPEARARFATDLRTAAQKIQAWIRFAEQRMRTEFLNNK
jgi:hypothetical protein